jgi:hypothetical protein
VAHGDTRWFVFDRQVKLPATAGGVSGTHGSDPQSVDTVGAPGRFQCGSLSRYDVPCPELGVGNATARVHPYAC